MQQDEIIRQGTPIDQASHALILLHGRGSTARDILSLADLVHHRFYIAAPQAPNKSWYPYSFMAEEKLNEPWLSTSVNQVRQLIDETSQHIPQEHIFIMGFSQGACLALETATRYAAKYGGVIAFTGGLIGQTINEMKYQGHFEETKVFIGNSDRDPHVPLIRSEESKRIMEKMGANVTLRVYPDMGHIINDDEINYVNKWILN
jgi:phospholipase/carboxylesterase